METKKSPTINPKPSTEAVKKPAPTAVHRPAVANMPKLSVKPAEAKPEAKAAQPTIVSKPVEHPITSASNNIPKPESIVTKKEKKSHKKSINKKTILGIGIAAVVIIALIILAITIANQPHGNTEGDTGEETVQTIEPTTEEENKITKETLDKYAEVTIDGYKKVDNNEISSDVVIVHVKNISEEQTSLAIAVVAEDNDGKVLDISYLYAEGITSGETQEFQTFVYTKMTPEQMQNAKYKVYKANTYEAPVPEEAPTEETTE